MGQRATRWRGEGTTSRRAASPPTVRPRCERQRDHRESNPQPAAGGQAVRTWLRCQQGLSPGSDLVLSQSQSPGRITGTQWASVWASLVWMWNSHIVIFISFWLFYISPNAQRQTELFWSGGFQSFSDLNKSQRRAYALGPFKLWKPPLWTYHCAGFAIIFDPYNFLCSLLLILQ